MYKKFFKRFFDILFSLLTLICFSWLYLLLMLLELIFHGWPIFFLQRRPGKNGKIFTLIKLRTMTNQRDENGELLPDAERQTVFGRLLRKTSLDEITEAVNILKGDMSLIGPRPLLEEYLPYYTEKEMHRHDVRPGLTGLAQVNGRNGISWERRFAYDLTYVENITFLGDLKILLMTVKQVFKREGVADDTREAEGNFAQIRQELAKSTK